MDKNSNSVSENSSIEVLDFEREQSLLARLFEVNLVIKIMGHVIVDWHFPPQKS